MAITINEDRRAGAQAIVTRNQVDDAECYRDLSTPAYCLSQCFNKQLSRSRQRSAGPSQDADVSVHRCIRDGDTPHTGGVMSGEGGADGLAIDEEGGGPQRRVLDIRESNDQE